MAEVVATVTINEVTHPHYKDSLLHWEKWRLTFHGGQEFINRYLKEFSKGENAGDFQSRKCVTYCPAFAKAAVIEVKNSIYQRMTDITREGGSRTYTEAVAGREGGVDMLGSAMNYFMGAEVLPELLSMSRVGIYVDMPVKQGDTLISDQKARPYLYIYRTEDIRSWDYDDNPNQNMFRAVLLRDYVYEYDELTQLPMGQSERFRFYFMRDGEVYVKFYDGVGKNVDIYGNEAPEDQVFETKLEGMTKIPFIMIDLEDSLLTDIADYQIALLNLASADLAYAIGANFPFYTEQYDPRYEATRLRPAMRQDTDLDGNVTQIQPPNENIDVGPASGRRYPLGTDRPEFIFPSSEPMRASMEKQEQMKLEIRLLINLAISNIQPKMASAESKGMDERTLESGLSYIGLILEDAERQIASIWAMYEKNKTVATVKYPEKYDLRSDNDRRKEAQELRKQLGDVPSTTYQRYIAKIIAGIMLGSKVSSETMKKIETEIEKAEIVNVIPDLLLKAQKQGLISAEHASEALGYPKDTLQKAQDEQASRLALIQAAQTNPAARGNPDASVNPAQEAQVEKDGKAGRGPAEPK